MPLVGKQGRDSLLDMPLAICSDGSCGLFDVRLAVGDTDAGYRHARGIGQVGQPVRAGVTCSRAYATSSRMSLSACSLRWRAPARAASSGSGQEWHQREQSSWNAPGPACG
jgi:hypothetical protein